MELQFEKTAWPCLVTVAAQAKQEEQTQEVRLGEQMPDIGKVLAAWGQVLLRGKEWRGSGIAVSAGVMAWVLYAPEDGSAPQLVETWIPVQIKWDFPETKHDGTIVANCLLSSVDARSVSARKLMVRAVVSVFGEAVMQDTVDVCRPGPIPEDVHVLKRMYPVSLPKEAGEKAFALEEELTLPTPPQRLIRYCLHPEIVDTNVVAGKAVFRGTCRLHVLYEDEGGEWNTHDQEFHFSQFADLEGDYDADARVRVVPAVTNLELETDETGHLRMKAGVVGQFVVSDRTVLEVVEDAYSNRRTVSVNREALMLPTELDQTMQNLRMTGEEELEGDRMVDVAFLCGHPRMKRDETEMILEQNGTFQLLYCDGGNVRGTVVHTQARGELPAGADARIWASTVPVGEPQAVLGGSRVNVRAEAAVTAVTTSEQGIPMVTGLELGEVTKPDPNRPSMILRRSGGQNLWELAKATGSTMEEITRTNGLQGEPEEDLLLLIPVM